MKPAYPEEEGERAAGQLAPVKLECHVPGHPQRVLGEVEDDVARCLAHRRADTSALGGVDELFQRRIAAGRALHHLTHFQSQFAHVQLGIG